VTTIGRPAGRPHRIEIWFAAQDGRVCLVAGGRRRAVRVRNLKASPRVTVQLERQEGDARITDLGRRTRPPPGELLGVRQARGGTGAAVLPGRTATV
jgi:hypothetical protein